MNYAEINGKQQPINVVPSNQVRCVTCNDQILLQEIVSHLQCHIQQKFKSARYNNSHLQRPTFNQFFKTQYDTETNDIAIHTMTDEELPREQQMMRVVRPPSVDLPISLNKVHRASQHLQIDPQDLSSTIHNDILNNQPIQLLQLEKSIDLKPNQGTLIKKGIKVYKNQQRGVVNIGLQATQKKLNINPVYTQAIPYQLLNTKQLPQSQIYPQSEIIKKIKLNITKNPNNIISTSTKSKVPQQQQQQLHSQVSVIHHIKNDLQCQCCHGFYCKVCKSTIPPKYRPIPHDKQTNNNSLDQQTITQYYKIHVHQRQSPCKYCANTSYST